ncbi:MAG TPA: translation initiation factor [Edaphocola sp.]|nr:translation initiation factor [Edaphocola sp.]
MSKSKKISLNSLSGLVYSTNPDAMQPIEEEEIITIAPSEQRLRVVLDKKQRAGKIVTLVEGFEGNEEDFQALGKMIKTKCGTGGTVKDGIILIQGNYKEKIFVWLKEWGYAKSKMV